MPNLSVLENISNPRISEILGIEFIAIDQAIRDTASSIIEHNPRWASWLEDLAAR